MRRTQIYLTDEQDARVATLAKARGESRAAVIREILSQGLDIGSAETDAHLAITGTAGICAEYPAWPEWLDAVRGSATADDRLTSLGL